MELCKRKLNSLVLVACLAAAPALAQTCPAPFPIVNGQAHAGSTCNYSNSLPMGTASIFRIVMWSTG